MTVRKVITIYNFPRRVPVTEIYSAISGNFRIAYTDGAGQSSIEVTAVQSSVEAGWVTALPEPVVLKVGWISNKMTVAPQFQIRGLETISPTQQSGRGPDSFLISAWIFVCTSYRPTDSHSMCSADYRQTDVNVAGHHTIHGTCSALALDYG